MPPRIARIGLLTPVARPDLEGAFRDGLRDLGYVEGRRILIETRGAAGQDDRLPGLAAELAGRAVDVIVTWSTPAALAARRATTTIPIVAMTGDPVAVGLAESVARPGGNLTGVTILDDELPVKQLELLREAIPAVTRVGVLAFPDNPVWALVLKRLETAAGLLHLKLQVMEIRDGTGFEAAFASAVRDRLGAMLVLRDARFSGYRDVLGKLAAHHRLPVMYGSRYFVEGGGLMAYEVDVRALMRRLAVYVDKILKGARPADLPIEQPTRFRLILNRKTAKALGLTLPAAVLARVDEVLD